MGPQTLRLKLLKIGATIILNTRRSRIMMIEAATVCSEIQQTWNRPDAERWAKAYSAVFPPYQLLIESYARAQRVVADHEELDSQRQ